MKSAAVVLPGYCVSAAARVGAEMVKHYQFLALEIGSLGYVGVEMFETRVTLMKLE